MQNGHDPKGGLSLDACLDERRLEIARGKEEADQIREQGYLLAMRRDSEARSELALRLLAEWEKEQIAMEDSHNG